MHFDLSTLLKQWPAEAGKLNVRLIEGDDGEPKIQLRLDLGILQLEMMGRPDGLTPEGFDSLLELHETAADEFAAEYGDDGDDEDDAESSFAHDSDTTSENKSENPFAIPPADCQALREEAAQYYHRYICLMALEDFDGVIRDTTRNMRVVDLLSQHAATDEDKASLQHVIPYLLMMRTRALASQALKDDERKAAIFAINRGLESLKACYTAQGNPDAFLTSNEAKALVSMRDTLVPKLPVSQEHELRQRLQQAIRDENYELAAILRDELKMLPPPPSPPASEKPSGGASSSGLNPEGGTPQVV